MSSVEGAPKKKGGRRKRKAIVKKSSPTLVVECPDNKVDNREDSKGKESKGESKADHIKVDSSKGDGSKEKHKPPISPVAPVKAPVKDIKEGMNKTFEAMVEDLLIQCKNKYNLPPPMLKRIKELCYYTIPGGKLYRGSLVINTVKAFYDAKGADASPMIPSAMVVAWCIEILQACFLIADDIMDKAPARRGKPCWHIKTGESMAFNDSVFLESTVYFFLKQHFSSSPAVYMGLTDLFREISFMTEMGQMMDLAAERCQGDATSLQGFNIEMYSQIAIKKTALYTFYLPIAAGMMLCGVSDQEVLTQCRAICEELGTKYQIQDDYLDCFGDVDVTGKIGTDIQDHKCTWLMIMALLLASLEQKSILQSNYGKSDEKSVERIKNMYIELGLKEAYLEQEQESYEKIKVKVEECSLIPRGVFMPILEKIHGRVK